MKINQAVPTRIIIATFIIIIFGFANIGYTALDTQFDPDYGPQTPPPPASSETSPTESTETGYQGINLNAPFAGLSKVDNLGEYIAAIYKYSLAIAGVLAGIMITIGGVKYLMSAGNAPAIASAKKTIFGALVGLILVFTSYIILNTVNPRLVSLRVPTVRLVPRAEDLRFTTGNFLEQCTPGTNKCVCRGADPGNADACDQSLKCVHTFNIITDAEQTATEVAGRAGMAAPILSFVFPPWGLASLGVSELAAGTALIIPRPPVYQCTNGADYSPCETNEQCQHGHCHAQFHICYPSPGILGGLCEDDDDCPSGAECEQNICLGQGNRGAPCRTDTNCYGGFACYKPASQGSIGKCGERFAGAAQEENYCILNQSGVLAGSGCGQLQCFYCPGTEPRTWTLLNSANDPQRRRVGQCKSAGENGERCAN